jgi:hypothetical protein
MMGVYAVPILVGLGWILIAAVMLSGSPFPYPLLASAQVFFLFGTVGNFAPFFEVIWSMRLDGRRMNVKDLLLLATGFLFNIAITCDAMVSLIIDALLRRHLVWVPTVHTGRM